MEYKLASISNRIVAHLIDSALLGLFAFVLSAFNIAEVKSFWLYFAIIFITIMYRPFMEGFLGATLGKMLFNLKVVNSDFRQITFTKALLRNIIFIIPSLLTIPTYYIVFNNPQIDTINNIIDFAKFVIDNYPININLQRLFSILMLIDFLYLVTDTKDKLRALHDRLAKTYVIVVAVE
jgi:uncharacterized RDD family membrane protein YckC